MSRKTPNPAKLYEPFADTMMATLSPSQQQTVNETPEYLLDRVKVATTILRCGHPGEALITFEEAMAALADLMAVAQVADRRLKATAIFTSA